MNEDENILTKDEEKAEILNALFALVLVSRYPVP